MKLYNSLISGFLPFMLSSWPALAVTNPPPIPHDFILGVAQSSEKAIPILERLNIQWTRAGVSWKQLTPKVIEPSLRLADVQGKPEQVRRLSQHVNWVPVDKRLRSILQRGIRPIVMVGHGYFQSHAELNGKPACPDLIGREEYLAQMYWTVRATVERYDGDGMDDAPGIIIKVWQMENELNEAGLTAAWGWREPAWLDGLRSAWADWSFLTRLLQTIHQAVKDADPGALTLMNFHTDVPPWISRLAGERGWLEAVHEWQVYMDIVGMDAYPNYFNPEPVDGAAVGARVAMIKKTAPGKPVFIMETDYPSGPAVLGFSPANQAQYVRESFQSARNAGADAYFKFCVVRSGMHNVTITDSDLERVKWMRQCVKNRRWPLLAGWALTHAGYIKSHFLDVLQAVEQYWGVFTLDGRGTAAFNEFKRIAEVGTNQLQRADSPRFP